MFSLPSCLSAKCYSASRCLGKIIDIKFEEGCCAELICENFLGWIYSKLKIKTPELSQWRPFRGFIVGLEHVYNVYYYWFWASIYLQILCVILLILNFYLNADTTSKRYFLRIRVMWSSKLQLLTRLSLFIRKTFTN